MLSNKGALSLVADYGGDSSEDEISGTRVSTKRLFSDNDENLPAKRFERLPVPDFQVMDESDEVIDDPQLHQGRTRNFKHERGNWATHVYIPYERNDGLERLQALITRTVPQNLDFQFFNEFHISLSKTVILRHHWITSFVEDLKGKLANFAKFLVMLENLEIYCNEDRTRTFLGLRIQTGYDSLCKIVTCVDNCLAEFKLPQFYDNPSFHISIGWCLGDQTEALKICLPGLKQAVQELQIEFAQENWFVYVSEIYCRIGNKLFCFSINK